MKYSGFATSLILKVVGQSIDYYMRHAYAWLGWGVKGARSQYAHDYYNKMTLA